MAEVTGSLPILVDADSGNKRCFIISFLLWWKFFFYSLLFDEGENHCSWEKLLIGLWWDYQSLSPRSSHLGERRSWCLCQKACSTWFFTHWSRKLIQADWTVHPQVLPFVFGHPVHCAPRPSADYPCKLRCSLWKLSKRASWSALSQFCRWELIRFWIPLTRWSVCFVFSASTVPGGPIGGQTRVYLRNEHLQYIITWYS